MSTFLDTLTARLQRTTCARIVLDTERLLHIANATSVTLGLVVPVQMGGDTWPWPKARRGRLTNLPSSMVQPKVIVAIGK